MKQLWGALALRRQLLTAWYALRDREASWTARLFAILIAGYVIDPIDLIPDVIPIIGWLDDLGLTALGIWLLKRSLSSALLQRAEARAEAALKRQNRWLGWLVLALAVWLGLLIALGWMLLRQLLLH